MTKMTNDNDDYKRGYRDGFQDGFQAARDNDSLMSPNVPNTDWTRLTCVKCGIVLSNMTGYVCTIYECPTQGRGIGR
jgi:hypothetical protein